MKILEIREEGPLKVAKAGLEGFVTEIDVTMIEDVKVGDYVIVHAGFAISKLSRQELDELLKIYSELSEALRVPK